MVNQTKGILSTEPSSKHFVMYNVPVVSDRVDDNPRNFHGLVERQVCQV